MLTRGPSSVAVFAAEKGVSEKSPYVCDSVHLRLHDKIWLQSSRLLASLETERRFFMYALCRTVASEEGTWFERSQAQADQGGRSICR
jgi:hypothetical protein